jgi:acyl-coenzyme A thioesterase PaaI-like protein
MMDLTHAPAVIAAIGSVSALISSLINRRKIQEVKVHINSRFDEFIAEARRVARAEGVAEGKSSQQKEK